MMYLIRHGQTVKNKENVLQGRSNSPLNEVGRQQAEAAGEMLKAAGDRKSTRLNSSHAR